MLTLALGGFRPVPYTPRAPRPALPALLALAAAGGAADVALAETQRARLWFTLAESLAILPWAAAVLRIRGAAAGRPRGWRPYLPQLVPIALVAACLASKWAVLHADGDALHAYRTYTALAALLAGAGLVGRGRRLGLLLAAAADQPARLMLVSFGATALLGGLVLTLPVSLRRLSDADFVDALFTATSAVCVTGLVVNDVGATYTRFGQAVLLGLIQAGGLGIMVLSTFFVIAAGRRLRLRSTAVLAETLDVESLVSLKLAIVRIVAATVVIEALGAAALYAVFLNHPDIELSPTPERPLSGPEGRAWSAVFHSVSAFCNAGFSLFPANLTPFVGDVPLNLVVAALIVLGGLGFPVLDELLRRARVARRGERPPRLSLHARTVLLASAALTLAQFGLLLPLEWERSLAGLPPADKLTAALFQSVTTRTAGFNTVDIGAMRPATLLLLCVAMFVGASPGSTGGGIKTTTFAALLALLRSVIAGERQPRLLDRALGPALLQRAIGVAFLSGVLVAGLGFVLLLSEPHAPERLIFEAVSAFGTVGLSTGITPSLGATGKLVLVATMIAGRIGPLTLALALAGRAGRQPPPLAPAEERLLIG